MDPRAMIRGIVKTEEGAPIPYATIFVLNDEVKRDIGSDYTGCFAFDLMSSTPVSLVVGCPGYETTTLDHVGPESQGIIIVLKQAASILGRLDRPAFPKRYEVLFSLIEGGSRKRFICAYPSTDRPQEFKVSGIGLGHWFIELNSEDFELVEPRDITIDERGKIYNVVLRIQPATESRGRKT